VTVCALIAAFNEEATIAAVVAGARRHVPDVFVIDDGSSDRTAERAEAAGAVVISHAENRGKGAAVRTGLARVFAGAWTHVLLLDGDLQHDPEDIPKLLAAGERSGCDLVIAERAFAKGEMPTARFYSNAIGSWILSRFVGTEMRDSQCGFRLVRTSCLRPLTLTATKYEIETEMLIKLIGRGASMCRVGIPARYNGSTSKLRSVRDTCRTCLKAVWYRYLGRS